MIKNSIEYFLNLDDKNKFFFIFIALLYIFSACWLIWFVFNIIYIIYKELPSVIQNACVLLIFSFSLFTSIFYSCKYIKLKEKYKHIPPQLKGFIVTYPKAFSANDNFYNSSLIIKFYNRLKEYCERKIDYELSQIKNSP